MDQAVQSPVPAGYPRDIAFGSSEGYFTIDSLAYPFTLPYIARFFQAPVSLLREKVGVKEPAGARRKPPARSGGRSMRRL